MSGAIHLEKSVLTGRRSRRPGLAFLGACLLASCATMPGESATPRLAGTAWQLIAIQSMDDAQGTTRIADPARFTLHFGTDGRATLRLDCNRGSGHYEFTASAESSGSLRFESIATTRALCAPPRFDERVARDLGYVRSYLIKNDKLFLSLMTDGGIYEWQSATMTTESDR